MTDCEGLTEMPPKSPQWRSGAPLTSPRPVVDQGGDLHGPWSAGRIIDHFDTQVAARPDAIAVDDGKVALTYRTLRNEAAALACQLAASAHDARPVAAVMLGTAHYAVALLAAIAAGRPLAPVDMAHPLERRQAILNETQPSILLVDAAVPIEPELAAGRPQIGVSLAGSTAMSWPTAEGDPIIGIAFTSGSMGRPKGLAYRQSAIQAMVAEHVTALGVGPDDVILSLASLGAGGNQDILSAILTGARVRLLDLKSVGIGETLRVMGDESATLLSMIPLVFRTLMAQPNAQSAFSSIRAISTGGDRLYGKDIDLFRGVLRPDALIRTTQGSTETGVVFQWIVPRDLDVAPDNPVPSGYVGPSHAVAISSPDDGGEVVDGQTGELMVSGANMAAGAWQNGRLMPGPFIQDDGPAPRRVYDSGDIMRRRSDGLFEFAGRRDRQIKMRGLRGDPGEVESALRRMAGVQDVAVIPRYRGPEAVFVAYVVPSDLYAPPSSASLRQALGAEVPSHMAPAEVRYLPSLPRLPNYKTNFSALIALDLASQGADSEAPPETDAVETDNPLITAAIRRAWKEILGVGASDKAFDEAGGDSLKLLQLALHLEEGLSRRLPLDLFDLGVTPRLLARKLALTAPTDTRSPSDLPLVVLCPGMGGDEPRLAAFRRAVGPRARFVVIEYPGLETSRARLADLNALVDDALDQARRAAPDGRFLLAGYSAGGIVAFEMAQRLGRQTTAPQSVSLIDLAATRPDKPDSGYKGVSLRDVFASLTQGALPDFAARLTNWGFFFLLDLRAFGLLRLLILTKSRIKGAHSVTFVRKVLLEYMRGPAILGWRPSRFDGAITLYRAETQRQPDATPDLGWRPWCDALSIVPCPGDHLSMLSSPNVEVLAARFDPSADAAAINATSSTQPTTTAHP
jgi:acyl-coenzyme A synthetase/AMP-(fatty) acid ligase/thioesterase domain-containing protein/acyl carrier protein